MVTYILKFDKVKKKFYIRTIIKWGKMYYG